MAALWAGTLSTVFRSIFGEAVFPVWDKGDGNGITAQCNSSGHLYVSCSSNALPTGAATETSLAKLVHGTWTPATADAASDSGVITAAPTTSTALIASNSHATTTVYLQIFDSAAVPANGTAPRIPSIPIAAGQTVAIPLGALSCAAGLSWAASSTVSTKTITAITPLQVSAEIR